RLDAQRPETGRGTERHLVGVAHGAPPRPHTRPHAELEVGDLGEAVVDVLAESVVDPVARVEVALRELRVRGARAPGHRGSSISTGPDATTAPSWFVIVRSTVTIGTPRTSS